MTRKKDKTYEDVRFEGMLQSLSNKKVKHKEGVKGYAIITEPPKKNE